MRLVPLTPDYPLTAFDCGDDDLNKFLLDDAKPSQELRIANTFILRADDGRIAAYFCLLNDKISKFPYILNVTFHQFQFKLTYLIGSRTVGTADDAAVKAGFDAAMAK